MPIRNLPFQLKVVDKSEEQQHVAFGLSDEKAEQIMEDIAAALAKYMDIGFEGDDEDEWVNVPAMMNEVFAKCMTAGQLVFAAYRLGYVVAELETENNDN